MTSRFFVLAAALTALVLSFAVPLRAADRQAYDATALAAEQKAGKSIVVHVTAPWCSTCKAQKPVLDKLTGEGEFKDFVVFDLDFDSGDEALRALNVRGQSTLVVYKGETETGRSAGDTNAESIAALLKTAL